MEIRFNGVLVQAPFVLEGLANADGTHALMTNHYIQETDGELVITFAGVDGSQALVSFIAVQDSDAPVPESYEVTFDADNGTEREVVIVVEGRTVRRPADPVNVGFDFIGWFLGYDEFDFNTAITGNIALTARWVRITGIIDVILGPTTYNIAAFEWRRRPTDAAENYSCAVY
jgi:hypothetical protein